MCEWTKTNLLRPRERAKYLRQICKSLGQVLSILFILLCSVAAQGQQTNLNLDSLTLRSGQLKLSPSTAKLTVQHQIQIPVKGSSDRSLRWYVNEVQGGNSALGFVTPQGLYTAPASVPPGGGVTLRALVNHRIVATASISIVYETQSGTPLRRSAENPRYFENAEGVIFLTGSHTWGNLRDRSDSDPPRAMDYQAYIDFLKSKNHNFTRLWAWELPKDRCEGRPHYAGLFPWPRTGPGTAPDGKPKFNLREFNSSYFDRLRSRVEQAQNNGIFVSVMLFEGFELIHCGARDDGFPFYVENNINGIDAAKGTSNWKRTGSFTDPHAFPFFTRYFCRHEWMTGTNPAVVEIQKKYVAKVIETLNGFDNVLWEIANESGANSTAWQEDMIRFIRESEAKLPKQHPIGFTFQYGTTCVGPTLTLVESDADWISPGEDLGDYRALKNGPASNDGEKVILSDTDHLWGIGGTPLWVWKSFTRGMNVLYMDDPFNYGGYLARTDDAVRQAMGDVLSFARKTQLSRLIPSTTVCSTGFGMTDNRTEFVCLAPTGGEFTVDLSMTARSVFSVEWFDISQRRSSLVTTVISGGRKQNISCPSGNGPCLLHLKVIKSRSPS
jgi:hypothetical protein